MPGYNIEICGVVGFYYVGPLAYEAVQRGIQLLPTGQNQQFRTLLQRSKVLRA